MSNYKEYEHKVRTLVPGTMYKSVEAKEFAFNSLKELKEIKAIEELTNIPISQIASLKKGDVVYFKQNDLKVHEGTISSINFNELYITILDGKTFIDFMLFNQYGKDRKTPYHCWCGAWALTREELEK